jgi:hypothetical protein
MVLKYTKKEILEVKLKSMYPFWIFKSFFHFNNMWMFEKLHQPNLPLNAIHLLGSFDMGLHDTLDSNLDII